MKNIFIGAVIGGLLLGAGFLLHGNAAPVATDPTSQPTGSVSSPDIQGNTYSVGGLTEWHYRSLMLKNASTTCSFKSPSSTSTLQYYGVSVASSSVAATIWEIGTAANAYSTTTLIGTKYNLAAGAQGSFVGSTTPSTGFPVIAPNTYVNLKVGAPAGGFPQGACDAQFIAL